MLVSVAWFKMGKGNWKEPKYLGSFVTVTKDPFSKNAQS